MSHVEELALQGHTNAIEFFGVDPGQLRLLDFDLLDGLRQVEVMAGGLGLY